VLISWFILSTFDYLFYKLSNEKSRNNEKIHFNIPCVLLNPIVQEKSDQDMNQWKKNKKRSNLQILVYNCHASLGTTFPAWQELQVLWPVWPKSVAMATTSCLARCRPSNKMLPWREWSSRTHVFQDHMSSWQQMSCLARKGGLG